MVLGKELGHEIPTTQKCNISTLQRNGIRCTVERTVFDDVEKIKYLGITVTNDLKWNTHVCNICTKANRILSFIGGMPAVSLQGSGAPSARVW